MSNLEEAITIALQAHRGQTDKGGHPYILHPLRVMLSMETQTERIVAVLHDVVEDSSWTFQALSEAGFGSEILEALDALTKRPGESRLEAAHRAAANPIARVTKLADLADNMDLTRIKWPSDEDISRLKVYERVRRVLLAQEGDQP